MSSQGFVGEVLRGIAEALEPLSDALASPEAFAALMDELGWTADPSTPAATIMQAFGTLPTDLSNLAKAADELARLPPNAAPPDVAAAIGKLGGAVGTVAANLRTLTRPSGTPPPPLDQPGFWASLAVELLDLLVHRYLERRLPQVLGLATFLGIATAEVQAPAGRAPYVRHTIRWDRVVTLATDPPRLFAEVYIKDGKLLHTLFLDNLAALCWQFGLPVELREPSAALLDHYYAPTAPARAELSELQAPLCWAIIEAGDATALLTVTLVLLPIPPKAPVGTSTAAPVGFTLTPEVSGQAALRFALSEGVDLSLAGGFESATGIRLDIRPSGADIAIAPSTGQLGAEARLTATPATPWRLLGDRASTRLELAAAHLSLAARGPSPSALEVVIEAGADSATLVVDFGEGDGFLQRVLGSQPQRFDFSMGLAWSSRSGFRFVGQGRLEASIPVHQSILGVVEVDTVYVALGAEATSRKAALTVALSGSLHLGPVIATVQRVGLSAELQDRTPPAPPGPLGNAGFDFAFKPPDGAGLTIDAAPVVGGGFLYFDPANEQYAGVLHLEAKGIALKAVGLLTTRMPDGSKGFSLLVIITAEFPPIQLGLGFTLTAVGGLLGLNRSMVVDVLRAGVKNRSLNSVLFPRDPVKNAPQIISDLRTVFPPAPGRFVVGPVARINWGTPPVLSIELGIVLSLPQPVTLVLLGRLRMALPNEDAAIVTINMDVLGVIEFDKSEASIDATLYDSRVAGFALTGDMAMRMSWGPKPAFALAAGGFNPRFQPPANFPKLERLAISLAAGENPRLRLEAYLALTANTVQIGARLDLYAAHDFGELVGRFSVEGYLLFDTLFQFSPFQLAVDLGAGVMLKRNGAVLFSVALDLHLTGPEPWHAWGTASFEIVVKGSISVDLRLGADQPPEPLPPSSPLDDLVAELNDLRNWSAQLPAAGHMLVSLREVPVAARQVLAHPLGELTLRQRKVPLNVTISRYGNTAPRGLSRFELGEIRLGQVPVTQRQFVRDHFAPASFFDLSDDAKLSRPSFELMDSGVRVGTAGITHAGALDTNFDYEDVVVDVPDKNTGIKIFTTLDASYAVPAATFGALAGWGAAADSPLRGSGEEKYRGRSLGIAADDPAYVVATTDQLKVPAEIGIAATDRLSYTEADERRRAYLQAHPEQAGRLQVVERHEVRP